MRQLTDYLISDEEKFTLWASYGSPAPINQSLTSRGVQRIISALRHRNPKLRMTMSDMGALLSDGGGWEAWEAAVAAEDERLASPQAVQVAAQPAAPPLAVPETVPVTAQAAEQSPAEPARRAAFCRIRLHLLVRVLAPPLLLLPHNGGGDFEGTLSAQLP
jgi:hypothetical protein